MSLNDRNIEVAIVGAGPAGSAAAIELARAGLRVVLIEKTLFPRDKICGGCLSGTATTRLQHILGNKRQLPGVEEHQITFAIGAYRLTFRPNGATRMVSRAELDACLANTAANSGAEVLYGQKASLEQDDGAWQVVIGDRCMRANVILIASGMGSIPRKLGIEGQTRKRRLIGQQWFQPADPPLPQLGDVEMHWLRGGYVGLATPEAHRSVVAIAAEAPLDPHSSAFEKLQQLNPQAPIWNILSTDAPKRYKAKGSAGFPWLPRELGRDNMLLIGDAAGFEEPYSGEGIGQAMLSATCAARAILDGSHILRRYTWLMRRYHRPAMWRTRLVSRLLKTTIVNFLASRQLALPQTTLSHIVGYIHAKRAS